MQRNCRGRVRDLSRSLRLVCGGKCSLVILLLLLTIIVLVLLAVVLNHGVGNEQAIIAWLRKTFNGAPTRGGTPWRTMRAGRNIPSAGGNNTRTGFTGFPRLRIPAYILQ